MATKTVAGPARWYVALIEDGVPKFSDRPAEHLTPDAARKEANRLAALHPGKAFSVFLKSGLDSVAEKPARLTYGQLKTAQPGVYKPFNPSGEAYSSFMKVLVMRHPCQENTLLYLEEPVDKGPWRIEPLDTTSWKKDLFELDRSVDPAKLVLRLSFTSLSK